MFTRAACIRIAQRASDADGRTRYVVWTTMGWRIEWEPTRNPATDDLIVTITPKQGNQGDMT